jgi:deazaflavin-dependent oxidoreductase (nitroreductase family)
VGDERLIGEELARWGKVALVETVGRRSGERASTAVGFVEEAGGALLVAAGSEQADWALNLRAHAGCRVTIGDQARPYAAEVLDGADRARTLTALILKYGTPAERLGRGPAFRLRPVRD